MAVVVGFFTGFGAIFFRWLIDFFTNFSFEEGKAAFAFLGQYSVVPIPVIGGFLVGLLVYFFAPEARGHGVPEVMHAVALEDGRIRPVVSIVKTLASSICIGTGGSAGREGPIVQIGSSLGSMLGQRLHLSAEGIRTLVACGAAGGIAATFNAPIAGAIFAAEIILGRFSTGYFVPIIIASVTANEISHIFLGNFPAFQVPSYELVGASELFLYAILGIIAAFVAVGFTRALYFTEDIFDKWKIPEYIKPAVGGLGIGLIGVSFPEIFGVGYETIETVLRNGNTELVFLATLLLVKVVATSLTLGSGGSGGVFAPSLFMGAMTGGVFGLLVHAWAPAATATSGAYALVGMAAVFSAATQAPITAILILFEMTRDYAIILPLSLAVAFSTVTAHLLFPETIYTLKLKRRGVDLSALENVDMMRYIKVKDTMNPLSRLVTVTPDMDFDVLSVLFQEHHSHGFAVVENGGKFAGIVTLSDLENAIRSGDMTKSVGEICTREVRSVHPDQTLREAMSHFGAQDIGRIPVLARDDNSRLLGMLGRGDIVRSLSRVVARAQPQKQKT